MLWAEGSTVAPTLPTKQTTDRSLIMCLGAGAQVPADLAEVLAQHWHDVQVHQARTRTTLQTVTSLAQVALRGRTASRVLVARLDSTPMTTQELDLVDQLNRQRRREQPGPAVVIAIDHLGQREDAVRHRGELAEAGVTAYVVDLGPLSDTPVTDRVTAAHGIDLDVSAIAAIYPYGPAISALLTGAGALGLPSQELAALGTVDRVDAAGAAETDVDDTADSADLQGSTPTVRWSELLALAAKPWAALNAADTARTQAAGPLVGRRSLGDFRDRHRGERCVIIGNGPSLNRLDLPAIAGETTFAVNSIYLATDTMGFAPTYYMVEDNLVMQENAREILAYRAGHKFFPTHYAPYFDTVPDNVTFFEMDDQFYKRGSASYGVPRFSGDFGLRGYCGQSVTILNLQLAFHMGFSEVVLIGMDFSYVIPDTAIREGTLITSTEEDQNHFHPGYFGPGKTWKDPKLERVLASYQLAKRVFEADGRRIVNATAGGALELFSRVDYHEMFGGRPPA